ncbi:MAG: PEP-CTERM sorting domain-containing protein [Gammaproteobacteria bacterium]
MNIFKNKFRLAFASVVLSALLPVTAFAMPTFLGSFQVDDGDWWSNNPDVYSGVEAAAYLFGGEAEDYRISIDASQDASTITDTAWYTIIGVAGGHIFADDYSVDALEDGYGGYGWFTGADVSALVGDNARGASYTNYVWLDSTAVSEPGTLALLGLGMFGLGVVRRHKKL